MKKGVWGSLVRGSGGRPPQKVQPSCTDSFEHLYLPVKMRDFRQFLSETKQCESQHFVFKQL